MPPKKAKSKTSISLMNDEICESCSIKIDENPLTCDICCAIFHPVCVGFSTSMYDKFIDMRDVVGWVCRECRKSSSLKIDKLQVSHSILADEICSLKIEIDQLKNQNSKVALSSSQPISYTDVLKAPAVKIELHKEVRTVIKDTEKRSRNIVISGLKPVLGSMDSALVEELLENNLSIKLPIDNNSCRRIGKEGNDKPRKLIVTLKSSDNANSIIRDAKLLRQSSDTYTVSNIYINKDLSPEESKAAFEKRALRRVQAGSGATSVSSDVPTGTTVQGQPSRDNRPGATVQGQTSRDNRPGTIVYAGTTVSAGSSVIQQSTSGRASSGATSSLSASTGNSASTSTATVASSLSSSSNNSNSISSSH